MAALLTIALTLFAQGNGDAAPPAGGSFWVTFLTLWLPIGLLFYFLLIRPQRREQAKREAMIRAVKENDHVLTVGGFYGVVTNVNREADVITLRVDEKNNTKIRVTQASIARVLTEQPAGEHPSK